MIFDTHAHYDDEAFNEDREVVISSLENAGIAKVVDIAASVESCQEVLELANKYPFMYCALGVHPEEVGALNEKILDDIKQLAKSSDKCVAIGEIGLDYYWDSVPRDIQKKWFSQQLNVALELKLPVVIHSREACEDTIDILKAEKAAEIGGVIHCYSYSVETAKTYLDMDFFFGIGGVVTYKNARKLVETVEYIPLNKIVLETDCPYLSPVPNRGTRNWSGNLSYVAEKIAEIKGISTEEVINQTWENAHKLYRL